MSVKRQVTSAIVLGSVLLGAPATHGAIVGYWKFDEASGTTATDSSGNGRTGTLGAGADEPTRIPSGRLGGAMDFNQDTPGTVGGGKLINVANNASLRLNNAFTVSFWMRPDYDVAASTFPGIMRFGNSQSDTGSNVGWGIFRNSAESLVYKRGNAQSTLTGALSLNVWSHVTIRYDGGTSTIGYVNGVQSGTSATAWLDANTPAAFEMGRMDAFDDFGLDDLALLDEDIGLAAARATYTAPTNLSLPLDFGDVRTFSTIHAGGTGSSGLVDGVTWAFTDSLPGSTTLGDAYYDGGNAYVVLGSGTGVTAPIPEPGTIGLLALASAGFGLRRRRR